MSRPLIWLQVVAIAIAITLWLSHQRACSSGPQDDCSQRFSDPAPGISSLAESMQWNSFKRQHPHLALAAEISVLWSLSPPAPLKEIVYACAGDRSGIMMLRRTSLAAAIRIQERDVLVERIICRGAYGTDDAPVRGFCDCLLQKLPREANVRLPPDLPDTILAPYNGPMTLTDLRIN